MESTTEEMVGVAVIKVVVAALRLALDLLANLNLTASLWPPVRQVDNNTIFDYVIVGGGTAGCILANRLTENPNVNVLLLEAGGNPGLRDLITLLFIGQPNSEADWAYESTFDPYAASSQNGFTKLQAGKVLGGSSSLVHLINVRGNREDYDSYARITGDDTWKYENVLPYFIKSERLEDPEIQNSQFGQYHGYDGYQGIAREPRESADVYLKSFNETGYPVLIDVNGNINIGYTQSLFYKTENVRQSTAYAYLRPVRNRPNLYVLRQSLVTKILFEGKQAVAVQVLRDGKTYVYRACQEVIVSAGVYNSPQLLMLSGIGPRDDLLSFGIELIADLPVGENFQDQASISLVYKTNPSIAIPIIPPPTEVPFPIIIGLGALNRSQPFADYQNFALVFPHDVPFILLTCGIIFPYRNELCDSFYDQSLGRNTLYIVMTNPTPNSRGSVKITSKDPTVKPAITTGYYTDKTDLENMVQYAREVTKVGNSSFFREVGAQLIDPNLEECNMYEFGSDDYFRCYIPRTTFSAYHSSSTCAMGSVLDSRFNVKGVSNLRVVDASALPHLTSGSPEAAVVMFAEKAADMIKEDNKQNSCVS